MFTYKDYERLKKQDRVIDETGNGTSGKPRNASAKFQKSEAHSGQKFGNRPSSKGADGRNQEPALVCINFRNNGARRDLDGQLATILDCLVGEGILPDDSVQYLDRIIVTHEKTKNIGFDVAIIEG